VSGRHGIGIRGILTREGVIQHHPSHVTSLTPVPLNIPTWRKTGGQLLGVIQ